MQGIPPTQLFAPQSLRKGEQSVNVLSVDTWGSCNPEPSAHLKPLTKKHLDICDVGDFSGGLCLSLSSSLWLGKTPQPRLCGSGEMGPVCSEMVLNLWVRIPLGVE